MAIIAGLASLAASATLTVPFEGSGTSSSPYLISSAEDLITLANLTSTNDYSEVYDGDVSNFANTFFRLTADIDFNYDDRFNGICRSNTSTVIKAIAFKGYFDGDGHTIHRMTLNGIIWSTEPNAAGLNGTPHPTFSDAATAFIANLGEGGTVCNLNIAADCSITGYTYTAAIVGKTGGSATIRNCRNYANVTAYGKYAGGIAAYGDGEIADCFNAGAINGGHSYAGGIAGHNIGKTTRCANTGNVALRTLSTLTGTLRLAGGIAGCANSGAMTDCVNAGAVHAQSGCGGLVGEVRSVLNSINYGMVTSDDGADTGAIAGQRSGTAFDLQPDNCYYDAQLLPIGAVNGAPFSRMNGVDTKELTGGAMPAGFDATTWSATAGSYPILKQFADEASLTAAAATVLFLADGDAVDAITANALLSSAIGLEWSLPSGAAFKIAGNALQTPSTPMASPEVLTARNGGYIKNISIRYVGQGTVQTGPFEGKGTPESPYLLSTADDLIKLCELTSTNSAERAPSMQTFEGKHFLITNDIDLAFDERFIGISVTSYFTLANYVQFRGIIDGGGHTIHHMQMGDIYWKTSPEETADGELPEVDTNASSALCNYASFVGRLGSGGVIRNLNIAADCEITGYSSLAGIVALVYNGALVENCRNYADVLAYSSLAGGIAADIANGGIVRNCYNAGNVTTGILYAGGIAGRNNGSIIQCANTGDIAGSHITSNIPEGEGFFSGIGGIAGNATDSTGSIDNCLNTGTISGECEVGGLLGSFGTASNSMNYGVVRSINTALSGNLFGNKANMSGKVLDNLYYDCQANRVRAISIEDFRYNPGDGTEKIQVTKGTLTTELVSGEALEGLNPRVWDFTEGKYPTLAAFADEPAMITARNIYLLMYPNNNAALVTLPITLHAPASVNWSTSGHFNISGGIAYPGLTGEATITASTPDGSFSRTYTCVIYSTTATPEIETDNAGNATVISSEWYTPEGRRVAAPTAPDGALYIRVDHLDNATTRTVKVLN